MNLICLADQVLGLVSGDRNYSENVADLGAVRLANNALAKELGPSLNLPDATGMTPGVTSRNGIYVR